ncbi:MAG: potassium transporter Kup [Thermoleophilia bacterium]
MAGALYLGALGVVFGDLGTSPLYTVQTVFNPDDPHPVAVSATAVLGIVSLIFWSVTLVVTVTYVTLVMRADNDGEGGIMALITLIRRRVPGLRGRTKAVLAAAGIFGAALFFGDSMITPAISVLSAVQGLEVAEPSLADAVVPIAVVILVALFLVQRVGTGVVGRFFGPVMVVWFSVIAVLGVHGIMERPSVLRALSPSYAVSFAAAEPATAFFALAAVVLAVTGAEALYADMGHFGRPAITRAWLTLVFPACILSYLGQGALILGDPAGAVANPFFLLAPSWAQVPLVVLATAATVIASQAVITGAFSVAHQAVQLGYLPRLRVRHTSWATIGQIYVPWMNWLLLVGVVALVLAFRSSTALAFAFGMAVVGTITITTVLFLVVARAGWGWPRWAIWGGGAVLLTVDLLFLAANVTKIPSGAWLPLLIGLVAFTVLTTWHTGRGIVTRERERHEGPLRVFIDRIRAARPPIGRVPGTAVFLNRNLSTTPLAMRSVVEHLGVLHEHAVILTVETVPSPRVAPADRLVIDDLGHRDDGITHARARFGYMERPDVPGVLRLLEHADVECPLEVDTATFFLSTIEVHVGELPDLARWRKRLFVATSHIAADAVEYFGLPRERTVLMGSRVEL